MINFLNKNIKASELIQSILIITIGFLLILFVIGTIFGLVRSSDSLPLFRLGSGEAQSSAGFLNSAQNNDMLVYSGLGRQRIPLSNSSTLILVMTFPYSANDIAFSEELAAKTGNLREIAEEYFSSLPITNINQIDENTAKQEILRRFNTILRLGGLENLYFNDMIIIE